MVELNIAQRESYLQLEDGFVGVLREVWNLIDPEMDGVLSAFYKHIQTVPAMAKLFEGRDLAAIKNAQLMHWKGVFADGFDEAYRKRVVRIGTAHDRIGLDPQWFFGGYCLILNRLYKALDSRLKWQAAKRQRYCEALTKVIFMDLDAVSAVYNGLNIERKQREYEASARIIGNFDVQVSGQVNTVAAATEELASSVRVMAEVSAKSREMTRQAMDQATSSTADNRKLGEAAQQISSVVDLIRDIADQTNLLALNAAIEAARAGDAGRGFAVVADEVKKLAQQTSTATQDIVKQIKDMQGTAEVVVASSNTVVRNLQTINESVDSIVRSISEQEIATRDISASMGAVQDAMKGLFKDFEDIKNGKI